MLPVAVRSPSPLPVAPARLFRSTRCPARHICAGAPRSPPCPSAPISPTTAVVPANTGSACGCGRAPAAPSSRPAAARAAGNSPSERSAGAGRRRRPPLMLPRPLRVTSRSEHRTAARRGRRAAAGTLTVHLLPPGATGGSGPARAGLVVGRSVGDAVTRHRVSRRLRHLLARRLPAIAAGSLVVVRAGTGADLPSAQLAASLDAALLRLVDRPRRRSEPPRMAAGRRGAPAGDVARRNSG